MYQYRFLPMLINESSILASADVHGISRSQKQRLIRLGYFKPWISTCYFSFVKSNSSYARRTRVHSLAACIYNLLSITTLVVDYEIAIFLCAMLVKPILGHVLPGHIPQIIYPR